MTARVYSQTHLFENDLFHGIEGSPDSYKNNEEFTYVERILDNSLKGPKADLVIKVSNDEIEIYYYKTGNDYQIRLIKIMKATDVNILGKYIGMQKSEIISTFGEPYIIGNHEIVYYDQKFLMYVNFEVKDNIITSIAFGYSI
jgi:hypothetical protein